MKTVKINLSRNAQEISPIDISLATNNVFFPGYHEFERFYLNNNGGTPDKNTTSGNFNETIRYFYPIKFRFSEKIDTLESINTFFRSRDDVADFFQKHLIFASDEGGNLWCIEFNSGSVAYVPMDSGSDLNSEKIEVASEFGGFLESLDFYDKVFT